MTRRLCWVSCGAASAVATKLDIVDHPNAARLLVYTDPGSEHPDNHRFLRDIEEWFGHPVRIARNGRYKDTWDVWQQTRFLVGPSGTRCTVELKKKVRFQIERPDDVQVFGYTVEERHRADRFREMNPEVTLHTPLIDRGLTKADCLAMVDRAGITLPIMYRYGFNNANCIGCPHGGFAYWNKIRRVFPEVFDRMAALERELNVSCSRDENGPVWLDELDPNRGSWADEPAMECSLLCALAESDLTPADSVEANP